ncbi:hypothetical protein EM6_1133 [Asticcacaulis excentricus]|uniref:Uncharacterized protein n=1 Tax=Asticcacaulis excentricus TaxID=78587 RepID=A0A3G9G8A5_9CAUL|nr:hypothetical protein EM6_1133 [Asticcacaulis excentricus]
MILTLIERIEYLKETVRRIQRVEIYRQKIEIIYNRVTEKEVEPALTKTLSQL